MRRKRVLFGLVVAQAITLPLGADEPVAGCAYDDSVLQRDIGPGEEWRLPYSAHRPDLVTEARIQVSLVPPGEGKKNWSARVQARFPDPKPFGIPYSFEKLEVRWGNASATASALLDWTGGCQSPGRSMFPGQSWIQEWEIPGTEGLPELDRPSFALWGGRN
jgi:hypothetical protein